MENPRENEEKTVANSQGSGIIEPKIEEFNPLPSDKVVNTLRQESESWIESLSKEEIRSIKKYTKNSGDTKGNKFFARLNAMLRGDLPEDTRLKYHADNISSGLKKNRLQHDIVCYRSVSVNPIQGLKVGDVYEPRQFCSTSITRNGALNRKYKMIINVPKGNNGAYIEKLSKYPNQREFLLDKDCKFRILYIQGSSIGLEAII